MNIEQIRSDACDVCLKVFFVFSVVGFFGTAIEIFVNGYTVTKAAYVVLGTCIILVALTRRKLPLKIKAGTIVLFLFLVGMGIIFEYGGYAVSVVFLAVVPVYATLFFGERIGVFSIAASIFGYVGVGVGGVLLGAIALPDGFVYHNLIYDSFTFSIGFVTAILCASIAIIKVFGALTKIIDDLQSEQQSLRAARDKAEAANKAKTEFLSAMSHDLRTPLNPILGFAEIIEGRMLGDNAVQVYAEHAGRIRQAGQGLLETLGSILDVSKLESGSIEVKDSAVDLEGTASEVAQIVFGAQVSRSMQLKFVGSVPCVSADPHLVRRIFFNLIDNAARHAVGGDTVRVEFKLLACGSVALSVRDNGPRYCVCTPSPHRRAVLDRHGPVQRQRRNAEPCCRSRSLDRHPIGGSAQRNILNSQSP